MKNLGIIDRPLLIFGGPYSNLAASEAMRARAESLGFAAGQIICTGDLVAYCAEPQQTVDMIRDWGIHLVMGNCEESLALEQSDCGCGFDEGSSCSLLSVTWYDYARRHIDADSRAWMSDLPRAIGFQMGRHRFRVVHGSVTSINAFIFASTPAETKRWQIEQADAEVVIGGHSGIPFGQTIDDKVWLNAGVIGLPANDASADGWYMLLEPTGHGFEASWHRLQYDAEKSSLATLEAGMHEYGQALTAGLWPSMDVLPAQERSNQGRRLNLEALRIDD